MILLLLFNYFFISAGDGNIGMIEALTHGSSAIILLLPLLYLYRVHTASSLNEQRGRWSSWHNQTSSGTAVQRYSGTYILCIHSKRHVLVVVSGSHHVSRFSRLFCFEKSAVCVHGAWSTGDVVINETITSTAVHHY